MQIGRLRHRITIETPTDVLDDFGESTKTWSSIGTVWASVEPLSGQEKFEALQIYPEASHKVRIRYLSGVSPDDHILFGSRTFEIVAVMNQMERNREIILTVKEAV
ncbi:hypothetical protein LCGC14_1839000 [marine sediment metagenome]|uniref:Phage head-tail adaptor n=1 Tax=marine sediment metagenome TaxID=412755 RepID=A0A0F9IT69_9ZZZZ